MHLVYITVHKAIVKPRGYRCQRAVPGNSLGIVIVVWFLDRTRRRDNITFHTYSEIVQGDGHLKSVCIINGVHVKRENRLTKGGHYSKYYGSNVCVHKGL